MGRAKARLAALRHSRAGLAFLLLLGAGAALRLAFMVAQRPALTGFPDTPVYLEGATNDPFWDQLRVVGYSYFLRLTDLLHLNLSATTLLQHGLGLLSGVALWDATRRVTGSAAAGLLPLAVVVLGGDQLFLEHAVLSEALFTFLVCATIWFAVRAEDASVAWVVAAALCVGLLTTVRLAGIFLIPLLAIWFFRGRASGRLLGADRTLIAAVAAGAVLIGYLALHEHHTDRFSFTRSGSYNIYGRAAIFADCREFDPPAGTERLCESTPPSKRPSVDFYNFDMGSPAARVFGGSAQFPTSPESVDKVASFGRAAILGQPLDYAGVVLRDLARFVVPERLARQSGNSPSGMRERYFDEQVITRTGPLVLAYTGTQGQHTSPGLVDRLKDYESVARIHGPIFVALLLLALAAPFVARGRARRGALLFLAFALCLAIVPVMTVFWDVRYAVPVYGPLAAAAACGAQALWARRRRRAPRPAA